MNNSSIQGNGIIGWFTANPVAANLLMILVIALGVFNAGDLQKEAFPSLEPSRLTVSIVYESGSAQQAEESLAIKIEEALEDVNGIKTITSNAASNGASVTIEKQSDYDLDTLLQDVKAKVDAISTFPADAEKPVITKAEREELGLPAHGVLIDEVNDGAGAEAGLVSGDVILQINSRKVSTAEELADEVGKLSPGARVPVLVQRQGSPLFMAIKIPGGNGED